MQGGEQCDEETTILMGLAVNAVVLDKYVVISQWSEKVSQSWMERSHRSRNSEAFNVKVVRCLSSNKPSRRLIDNFTGDGIDIVKTGKQR